MIVSNLFRVIEQVPVRAIKSVNYKKRAIFIPIFSMLMILFMIFPSYEVMARVDMDQCGIFRNYNCDNTIEDDIDYDAIDDHAWKVFFVSETEYSRGDYCYLWIYAKCFGTKNIVPDETHEIRNYYSMGADGEPLTSDDLYRSVAKFKCYERFSYDVYQWAMFEFSRSKLEMNHWNRFEICDVTPWNYDNIRVGIDTTYGGTQEDSNAGIIHDFDTSYWYSNFNQSHMFGNNGDCHGELMMKLEVCDQQTHLKYFPSITQDNYWTDYYPYSYIFIDYNDDWIKYHVTLTANDLSNSDYSRLYIYGYSWVVGNPPPNLDNHFKAVVNNHAIYFDPEILWAQSGGVGQWNWIRVDNSFLVAGDNTIYLEKDNVLDPDDYKRHNLAVAYFSDVDQDHSAWYWFTDHAHGDIQLRYNFCNGEVAMFLDVYRKTSGDNSIGGWSLYCSGANHAWSDDDHSDITQNDVVLIDTGSPGLEDYGWVDKYYSDNNHDNNNVWIRQGMFGGEGWNGLNCGDDVDLLLATGHGEPRAIILQDNDFDPAAGEDPPPAWGDCQDPYMTDDQAIGIFSPSDCNYLEVDNWEEWRQDHTPFDFYEDEFAQDGWNFDCDYILISACFVLSGAPDADRLDPDTFKPKNPWQFSLYHGVGIMMGFATIMNGDDAQIADFYSQLVTNWCVYDPNNGLPMTVINGFTDAVKVHLQSNNNDTVAPDPDQGYANATWPTNRYVYYYHEWNVNDYLNPMVETDYDWVYGYEDHQILFKKDPLELTIV